MAAEVIGVKIFMVIIWWRFGGALNATGLYVRSLRELVVDILKIDDLL
jgi:hypothetical protein